MKRLLPFFALLFLMSSCKVFFPNYLLRETKDFYYFDMVEQAEAFHTVMPGDYISFFVTPMSGMKLIDPFGAEEGSAGGLGAQRMMMRGADYFVRDDGIVDLPVLGELYVKGKNRLDLEKELREKFSVIFVDPYLIVNVSNRRAFLMAGLGSAKVIPLPRENTTLVELLALSGGIGGGAKSHKIRIIRGDYNNPTIKKIDLSTIKGLTDASTIIHANDLIIIDPVTRAVPAVLREIAPILTLLTTLVTLSLFYRRF